MNRAGVLVVCAMYRRTRRAVTRVSEAAARTTVRVRRALLRWPREIAITAARRAFAVGTRPVCGRRGALRAGLRHRVVAPCVFDGAINGTLFLAYVEQMLVPWPPLRWP